MPETRKIQCSRCKQIGDVVLGERGEAALDRLGPMICKGCVTAGEEVKIGEAGTERYDPASDTFSGEDGAR